MSSRRVVSLILTLILAWFAAPAQAQTQTVPFKVYITELWQLDAGVDPDIGFIADYYARVTINGHAQDNKGACGDGLTTGIIVPFRLFKYFERIDECSARTPWLFTAQVPAGQPVHVKIQVFDEDTFSDDEADLKTGEGNAIEFDVDPSTGQWAGDVNWPQDCSRPSLVLGGNNANVCWQASFDSDNDGLLDVWERFGVDTDNDGVIDTLLPGADPLRKDLYIEADYLQATTHTHAPTSDAISRIVAAYANAPIANPDGTSGVQLHVDVGPLYGANVITNVTGPHGVVGTYGDLGGGNAIDEAGNEIIDSSFKKAASGTVAFADVKNLNFDHFKREFLYRYMVFGHQTNARAAVNDCTSGVASPNQHDFMVTLGGVGSDGGACWGIDVNGFSVGSLDQQSGTFMHELGHSVGLGHGGGDSINNKPNYLSVMNYSYSGCTIPADADLLAGGCDYQRLVNGDVPPPLDERNLDECVGLGSVLGLGPIDWNGDGIFESPTICATLNVGKFAPDPTKAVVDVNNDGVCIKPGPNKQLDTTRIGDDGLNEGNITDGKDRVCQTAKTDGSDDVQLTAVGDTPEQPDVLTSFDDWGHLDFKSLLDHLIQDDANKSGFGQEPDPKTVADARTHLREISAPILNVTQTGPATAKPGDVVNVMINVSNTGRGPALGTKVQTTNPDGSVTTTDLGTIAAGSTVTRTTSSITVPQNACPGDLAGATAALSFTDLPGDALTARAASNLQILDVEAPRFDLYLSPDVLWPPDHKLRRVEAEIRTHDICDRYPTVTLVSIVSNEPDDHDHGRDHDDDDIQGATFGTDDRVFFLRAERETGHGHNGRVYTVTYRVTDKSGNATTKSATVVVPENRRGDGGY